MVFVLFLFADCADEGLVLALLIDADSRKRFSFVAVHLARLVGDLLD